MVRFCMLAAFYAFESAEAGAELLPRLSIGQENVEDILEDVQQALDRV